MNCFLIALPSSAQPSSGLQAFGDLFGFEQRHARWMLRHRRRRTRRFQSRPARAGSRSRRAGSAARSNTRSRDQLDRQRREHDAVAIVRRRVDQARHRRSSGRASAGRPGPSAEGRCERRSSPRRRGPAPATPPPRAASRPLRRCALRRSRRLRRSIRPAPIRPATAPGSRRAPRSRGESAPGSACSWISWPRIGLTGTGSAPATVIVDDQLPAARTTRSASQHRSTMSARRRDRPASRRSGSRRCRTVNRAPDFRAAAAAASVSDGHADEAVGRNQQRAPRAAATQAARDRRTPPAPSNAPRCLRCRSAPASSPRRSTSASENASSNVPLRW